MDAVEFFKEKARMCKNVKCLDCQLQGACDNFITNGAYEFVVKAVERWAKENPRETRWTLLKKRYPTLNDNEKKHFCVRCLGYKCDCDLNCAKYWDMPIEE